jgi:hypothetical protein
MTSEVLAKAVAAAIDAAEPATTYNLDCFVTSEVGHNDLLTRCRPVRQGGAYVGVGPCQNFSYIGALRPSCALIVDARIDNLIEHLIFKLVFERARTPAQYLAVLCSRHLPADVPPEPGALLSAFDQAAAPAELFGANWLALRGGLAGRWGLPPALLARAERIYREFHRRGLSITSVNAELLARLDYIPDLRTVIASTSYTGESLHFLTDARRYDYVREMQLSDRIIPLLGNVSDAGTIDAANSLLAELGEQVSTVYLSNMEEFLLHRYEIGSDGIASRPNPMGTLSGEWGAAYGRLVRALRQLDTTDECLLIRHLFPGEDHNFSYGVFPWLAGSILPLRRFLRRYDTEAPQTVFDTYW